MAACGASSRAPRTDSVPAALRGYTSPAAAADVRAASREPRAANRFKARATTDPANAGYYTGNATALKARIDDLDQRFEQASATVAPAHRKLLTYHDAYAYFAAHYGWTVIGAIQVSSFEDPTPKEVAGL